MFGPRRKSYPCCVDHFTLLSVTCTLARKPQFYRYLTVGPAAVLGLLVPVLFLLPARTREKTTYGEESGLGEGRVGCMDVFVCVCV